MSQESSPAEGGTTWNTVAGDGFELFFGYRDEAAPINRLRTDRAPLAEFASLHGFPASENLTKAQPADSRPASS